MKTMFWVGLILGITSCSASAQQFMDGSKAVITDQERSLLSDLLFFQLTDPFAAQIARLEKSASGTRYCGFLNARNQTGGYDGFKSFAFDPAHAKLYLDVPCR